MTINELIAGVKELERKKKKPSTWANNPPDPTDRRFYQYTIRRIAAREMI